MDKKIQVLDVSIDNYRAKEAMKKVMEYVKTEPVNVIEMVTMNNLMQLLKTEEHKKYIGEFDLTFYGNKSILEAAGVTDAARLKEVESLLFVKMIMKFLHKNHSRVFLFAENETALHEMRSVMEENYPGIKIAETATIQEHGKSDDMIINRINGAEADWVISILPSPLQEEFIIRSRSLLNARIWLGLGTEMRQKKNMRFGKSGLKNFSSIVS